MNNTPDPRSPAQRAADTYAATVANGALKASTWTARLANVLALSAMTTTINHQHDVFAAGGMPEVGAWGIPATIDLLTFTLMMVVGSAALVTGARVSALGLLCLPVSASALLNAAGSATALVRGAYVAVVIAIPVAKAAALLAHRIDWTRLLKAETTVTAIAAVTEAPAVDPIEAAKRSESARKAAATRRDHAAAAQALKAERAARRAQKAAERAALESAYALPDAPVSPAAPLDRGAHPDYI